MNSNPTVNPSLPLTRRDFWGLFGDEKKTRGSASIDASRLIFQSAVSFSNLLGPLSNPLGCDNIFQTSPGTICQCESHIYQNQS